MNEDLYVYLHENVHKDQLRALLKDCGFSTVPETFRALVAGPDGRYSNTLIRVAGGKAVCLSPEEAGLFIKNPGIVHMHEVLGPRVLTNVSITAATPGLPGTAALVRADVHGQPATARPVGPELYDRYLQGQCTAPEIASGVFSDLMVGWHRTVRTDVDCGYRWSDGSRTVYHGDYTGDGTVYKDLTAFDEQDGICYISEANLADYGQQLSENGAADVAEYGDTYSDLVVHARELAFRSPEQVARMALEDATWMSVHTGLDEYHNRCEAEDLLDLDEEVLDKYSLYVEQQGTEPRYAEVFVEWKDDRASQRDMIALGAEAGEPANEEVVFTCSGFEEFRRLTSEDNGQDFVVREIYGYHDGAMDGQKRSFDDGDIHDVLDAIVRQAQQAGEPASHDRTDTLDVGATLVEAEVPWYEDLSRISDVQVYRNPRNTSATEYRMRCRIDGEPQMGRILFPGQVVELANGADKAAMAAKVFAREMTLNNPHDCGRRKGMGL